MSRLPMLLLMGFFHFGEDRPKDADIYAAKVIDGLRVVRDEHVKGRPLVQLAEWGVRGLYEALDEPVPDAVEARLRRLVAGTADAEVARILADCRAALGIHAALDKDRDVTLTLRGAIARLDARSTYYDNDEWGAQNGCELFDQRYRGVGLKLRLDHVTGDLVVETPLLHGPAHRAGLAPGDRLVRIIRINEGERQEPIPTRGLSVADAQRRLCGLPGEPVVVVVSSVAGVEREVTLHFGDSAPEPILGYRRDRATNTWSFWADEARGIAYCRIPAFALDTSRTLADTLERLNRHRRVRGVVLDLRGTQGGLLTEAVRVADLFLANEAIVGLRTRERTVVYHGRNEGRQFGYPLVCLVDGDTVSSGEVLAAALQDHQRARVIGTRTPGLTSICRYEDCNAGKLLLTVASFERPSGRNLNRWNLPGEERKWGVVPDEVVPLTGLAASLRRDEAVYPNGTARPRNQFVDHQLAAALKGWR